MPAPLVSSLSGCQPRGTVIVRQARLKRSFIYLANAVNDLRGNWGLIALTLAPLVLLAALCLLPDAINLQHEVATRFAHGVHNVGYLPVQIPYGPAVQPPDLLPVAWWVIWILHGILGLITLLVNLVVLCALERIRRGEHAQTLTADGLAVYRRSISLIPPFFWVVLLQAVTIATGVMLLMIPVVFVLLWFLLMHYSFVFDFRLLAVPAGFVLIWVYFAQYALVFDKKSSWPALLHSREVVRGRYFKVAARIVVFLAVWSGFNSWAGGAFILMSLVIGPVAAITDTLRSVIFLIDIATVGVAFTTSAFLTTAGVRLYQDLITPAADRAQVLAQAIEEPSPTAPLSGAGSA